MWIKYENSLSWQTCVNINLWTFLCFCIYNKPLYCSKPYHTFSCKAKTILIYWYVSKQNSKSSFIAKVRPFRESKDFLPIYFPWIPAQGNLPINILIVLCYSTGILLLNWLFWVFAFSSCNIKTISYQLSTETSTLRLFFFSFLKLSAIYRNIYTKVVFFSFLKLSAIYRNIYTKVVFIHKIFNALDMITARYLQNAAYIKDL